MKAACNETEKKEKRGLPRELPDPRSPLRHSSLPYHLAVTPLALYMVYLAFDMVRTPILLASRLDAFAPWWLRC